jgi:hypothetical protein
MKFNFSITLVLFSEKKELGNTWAQQYRKEAWTPPFNKNGENKTIDFEEMGRWGRRGRKRYEKTPVSVASFQLPPLSLLFSSSPIP